ncbi:fibronectin type III domain-containing protein [Streptomyces sp. NPDC001941]|uniref:fibronectin type III domain-containing protein n=1 Tax=Streptomyces sp. NPDC001941 TaxID=3154659 RepID=UPI00331C9F02
MQRPLATVLLALISLAASACGGGRAEDTSPPGAPTGVTAQSGSATTVHVMWSAARDDRGVSGYEVYQRGRVVKEVSGGTLMTDVVGLAPGSPYSFTVRARDAAGNRSAPSAAVPVTTLRATARDTRPPTAPGRLTGRADTGGPGVTLSWTRAADDRGVTSYDVYQADSRVHTVPGTATTAHLAGLRPGTIYSFTVRARDAADNSSPDSPVADLTTAGRAGEGPSTAPTGLRAEAVTKGGVRSIELSWLPPGTGAPIREHQLYLNGKFATTVVWGAEPPPGRAAYSFTVSDPPGTRYSVKVRAKLPDGTWGDFSAQRTVVVSR